MKNILAIALIGLASVSCSKEEASVPGDAAQGGAISFSAAAPVATRSYFPGSVGTMYWDTYDNLGVYALKGGVLQAQDFCAIASASAGTNEATFAPKNILYTAEWADNSADEYTFCAYYPQTAAPAATWQAGSVLLHIPAAQTGEFGRHHICCSAPVTMTGAAIAKNKSVRFAFSPASSMVRVRLVVDAASDVAETYIKQVTMTATGVALTGGCKLTLADGKLAPTATLSSSDRSVVTVNLPSPVKITKTAADNPYIDLVILPVAPAGNIAFSAITSDGVRLTIAQKTAPQGGFVAGTRYGIDRNITMTLDDDSPDGAYIDGGSAWESKIDNDGAYTDGGYAW